MTAFLQWKLRRVHEQQEEARASGTLHNCTMTAHESWNPPAEKRAQTGGVLPTVTSQGEQCSSLSNAVVAHAHVLGMPSGTLLWGILSVGCWQRSLQGFTTCFPNERGGWVDGHLNLFKGGGNWTKRLAHPRGRSICFSSGQSGTCAGTQSTVNILWGPAKILPLVAAERIGNQRTKWIGHILPTSQN